MLGDGRLRDPGLGRQRPDRLFAVAAQLLEDPPAGGIGEGSEEDVVSDRHGKSITRWLWIIHNH
jgi:hypothetical protein